MNDCQRMPEMKVGESGGLIFMHLRCWKVLPFLTIQRQRCIKMLCPKDPEFYTPLALNCQKGQHLPALEVYKYQSPRKRLLGDRFLSSAGAGGNCAQPVRLPQPNTG